ncbi:predicted protein [Chaetomium globosum CBS 148.51]|uniref:Uncharacterized protein n=1 Tax=Chaetomium globosum (strain ATCC 6205 / CBS 148.51 / DSM 1962 / NBRC 6347 / NRRL 1970) TaxID=306901 RepID=Q2H077_CHAGB|nr:uncharacterized protein CHGG_04819 [Chaetomium globosum CBS 148.51]EAQ88200.1 predicted protein [Chaetomium globosum CBS 148.51]
MQVSQASLGKGDTEVSPFPSEATKASGRRNKRPTPENADSPRSCRLRLLLQPTRRRMVPTFRCFVVRGLTLRKEAGGRETDPGMPPCVVLARDRAIPGLRESIVSFLTDGVRR